MSKLKESWKLARGSWISTNPVLPGVWKRKEGGHVVRARVTSPRTGKKTHLWKVLPELTAAEALHWLEQECARVRRDESRVVQSQTRFASYAVSLLERKITARDIKSEAGIRKWNICLKRLFEFPLAELFIEKMRTQDFAEWRDTCARMIADGRYSPITMNTDLSILRVIVSTAKIELGLTMNPIEGIAPFDTSQHPTYTFEEPNSLTVEELRDFLRCMLQMFPAHYAMTFLGFTLGKRPSTTRPLRRKGPTVDVLWDTGVLLFRRSNTHGQLVMEGVKTGGEERVQVPEDVLRVLGWHVETQLRSPAQRASDLLFPGVHGGFRARSVLDKPFRAVAQAMGLGKRITPRGMRRTFQDVCRLASVGDLVTRSISGHATESMQRHYSTVALEEQRRGLANVLQLLRPSQPRDSEGAGQGAGTPVEGAGSAFVQLGEEENLSI
jgi:hypothetical protein